MSLAPALGTKFRLAPGQPGVPGSFNHGLAQAGEDPNSRLACGRGPLRSPGLTYSARDIHLAKLASKSCLPSGVSTHQITWATMTLGTSA